jgi:ankyrin repeat protein
MNDTPLIWAAEMGSTECVQKLLDAGADPNVFELDGWSALHWAARDGHLAVSELLLEKNAQLDHPARDGNTPLDWALDREHWDVVYLFEEWVAKNDPGNLHTYSRQPDATGEIMGNRRSRKPGQLWDCRP